MFHNIKMVWGGAGGQGTVKNERIDKSYRLPRIMTSAGGWLLIQTKDEILGGPGSIKTVKTWFYCKLLAAPELPAGLVFLVGLRTAQPVV